MKIRLKIKLIPKNQIGNKIIPSKGTVQEFPDMLTEQTNKLGYYDKNNTYIPGVTGYYLNTGQMVLPFLKVDNEYNISLPNVEVTPRNINLEAVVDEGRDKIGKLIYNMSTYMSPTGDAEDAFQVKTDILNGNYGLAALGAGLLLLPNIIEKPIKGAIKAGKKLFKPTSKAISLLSIKDVLNLTDLKWDDLYNRAIQSGNKEEVQKIRDLHFLSKAPDTKIIDNNGDIKPLYRWDDDEFFIFDKTKQGTKYKPFYGKGFYFTGSKYFANWFGNKHPAKKYLINSPKIEKVDWDKTYKNNYINGDYNDYGDRYISNIRYNIPRLKNKTLDEYVISEPSLIKSANPITYDNTGKIIPISKRDNFSSPDIRYGLVPLIGLGFLNKNQNKNESK